MDNICFCPPERLPARDSQNRRSAGKKPKIHSSCLVVHRPVAGGENEILFHREIGEHRHALRHVTDAEPCDVGRRAALDALAGEADLAAGGLPEAH
ncbi:hypothetical protein QUS58_22590, partial [Xanthomonas citri pv. citri]